MRLATSAVLAFVLLTALVDSAEGRGERVRRTALAAELPEPSAILSKDPSLLFSEGGLARLRVLALGHELASLPKGELQSLRVDTAELLELCPLSRGGVQLSGVIDELTSRHEVARYEAAARCLDRAGDEAERARTLALELADGLRELQGIVTAHRRLLHQVGAAQLVASPADGTEMGSVEAMRSHLPSLVPDELTPEIADEMSSRRMPLQSASAKVQARLHGEWPFHEQLLAYRNEADALVELSDELAHLLHSVPAGCPALADFGIVNRRLAVDVRDVSELVAAYQDELRQASKLCGPHAIPAVSPLP